MQGMGDVYEDRPVKRTNTSGGIHGDVAALTAISATSQVPQKIDCELCRATFTSETLYRQHINSTVHRKAIEKLDAELARKQRMSAYNDVAEAALGAAAWNNTHGGAKGGLSSVGGGGGKPRTGHPSNGVSTENQTGKLQQQKRLQPRDEKNQQVKPGDVLTHAEVIARMTRGGDEEAGPVTIDGWAPPSIAASASSLASDSKGDEDEEDAAQRIGVQSMTSLEASQAVPPCAARDPDKQDGTSEGSDEGEDLLGLNYSDSDDSKDSDENDSDGPPLVSFF